ncbi:hypothetical protein F8388_005584 [Cannabis sativa]|uniref:DNA-directed RNA polymerases I and III subunit RPAC2 n=2 Tax=Cannabis sativa TaxID=3483 RepID=A0A7J6DTW7_CANSA|nr:hypothetical protein G4B88_026226 [Cannabis sativa]KAF4387967.1 hypothetical protein F8388_005584 [Cannabis sativa]
MKTQYRWKPLEPEVLATSSLALSSSSRSKDSKNPGDTEFSGVMEHGSFSDLSKSSFSLTDEDHTLANSIRFTLNQDPRVTFCGYSIPHPSDNRVNIRIQTTGEPATDIMKDACQDLMLVCKHVRETFDQAVVDFKKSNNDMDVN